MPYHSTGRLANETASKLGHLDVLNSQFVNEVVDAFEFPEVTEEPGEETWVPFSLEVAKALPLVFATDGSFQIVRSERPPFREVGFVKTALLRMDPRLLEDIDRRYPHPHKLREVMRESALYHSTVFPLRGVEFSTTSWMDAVRQLIQDSLLDPRTRDAGIWETLKWLLYKKWDPNSSSPSPSFACPSCNVELAGLDHDTEGSTCPHCRSTVGLVDVIGLHMEMFEDGASQALATAYMNIHELLLLLSAIRYFWENNRRMLGRALFLKDGPLTLRGQYSKLVPNIREFLAFAAAQGCLVHLVGQEKTGKFVDHLQVIQRHTEPHKAGDDPRYFILSHDYIRRRVQRVRESQYQYGERTNYGEKVFTKLNPYHSMVLSVATGEYDNRDTFPSESTDFIGLDEILCTLPDLISHQHEGALIPIELAHGVASLSSYPSAQVLKLFTGIED